MTDDADSAIAVGQILIGSGADKDKGAANFIEALKIEATLALDPDIKTKELDTAFEAARKKAGSAATAAAPAGAAPAGDFTHTPIAGQAVRTPVPIYAEYTGSEQLEKVVAKYKGFGMTEWKQIELKKMGKGYGSEVPCMDVQQGDLQYYLQGFNAQKNGGLNLEHAYSHREPQWPAYYYLLQIAHMILQLLEKGSLLRNLAAEQGKTFKQLFGSLKNLVERLRESVRFLWWPEQVFDPAATGQIQIRLDTS